ncbi:DUF3710 domain-containing protein [Pseudactinotalea sp. HY160]|uniref:DUF3710 domain-containing protein n=1 Tax=Pseudactinotalea sp. HY160 TaxID=2654490 RepID=UPI0013115A0A|nr:DUF3710 domain-containing protein [Pseudactinotalea sp. HY160]
MSFFRRKNSRAAAPPQEAAEPAEETSAGTRAPGPVNTANTGDPVDPVDPVDTVNTGEPTGPGDPDGADGAAARGPWDLDEQPELGTRVDVGGLRIPARQGMQVRMELEPKSRRIVSVNIALGGSALQLQAFAAPRSEGLWETLRPEIVESITKQGGTVEAREGGFGEELLARLPVRTKDGRSGHRPARFLGFDGSRWFLRGVLTGPAAVDPEAGAALEEVFADVVVVRGTAPRAPRDLLPLHLPGKPGEEVAPEPTRPVLDLGQGRGPEITEVG